MELLGIKHIVGTITTFGVGRSMRTHDKIVAVVTHGSITVEVPLPPDLIKEIKDFTFLVAEEKIKAASKELAAT